MTAFRTPSTALSALCMGKRSNRTVVLNRRAATPDRMFALAPCAQARDYHHCLARRDGAKISRFPKSNGACPEGTSPADVNARTGAGRLESLLDAELVRKPRRPSSATPSIATVEPPSGTVFVGDVICEPECTESNVPPPPPMSSPAMLPWSETICRSGARKMPSTVASTQRGKTYCLHVRV